VLLELCDRILVLCGGEGQRHRGRPSATKEEIGLMMTQTCRSKGGTGMSTADAEHKEPLIRISKRTGISHGKAWGIRGIALCCPGRLRLVIFAIVKLNPVKVYAPCSTGPSAPPSAAWATIRDTMMLLCIAVGLAPAFKMKFWNIGAEGQILVGGIATAACMIYYRRPPCPPPCCSW
jgi:hypothetical protein